MRQGRVEIVRSTHAAYEAADIDAFLAGLHPEVEWRPLDLRLTGTTTVYRGRDAVEAWMRKLMASDAEVVSELRKVMDLGRSVLALGSITLRHAGRPEVSRAVAWVCAVDELGIRSVTVYPSDGDGESDAQAAATAEIRGLREP